MSLEHAILGFLNYQPFSGYDLKKLFDSSVRHFWPADQSQIYRTLSRMAEKDWVEMEVIEQTDRPDRKIHHITGEGREELLTWLAGPVPTEESRSAPLVQIFFSGQLSNEQILAKFNFAVQSIRSVLEIYAQVPQTIEAIAPIANSPREVFCWQLTLESGIHMMQSQLEWAESVIRRIENNEIPEF
jgi:PadR family transcriptional regulator, regulatory protein AphA